jgi:hypothetical protein
MDIGKSFQQAFDLYTKNFVTLFLACLVAGLLSMVTIGILAGPLFGGVLVLCIKLMRGEKGEVSEVFAHFDKFLPAFLVTLMLWGITILLWIIAFVPIIGWILQLVVAPVMGLLFFVAIGYVVDQKMEPVASVRRSIDNYASEPLMLWVYAVLFGILASVGAILFGIGILLTLPFGVVGYAIAYQTLSAKEPLPFKPEKQKLQIAGIAVAVLLVIGMAVMIFGFGRTSSRMGTGFASKILSTTTGQKVKMDKSGTNISFGDLNIGAGLPKNFPKDIPIYPNAEVGGHMSGKNKDIMGSTTTFTSKDKASDIYDYYVKRFSGAEVTTSQYGEMRMINAAQKDRNVTVTINPSGSKTDIIIVIASE